MGSAPESLEKVNHLGLQSGPAVELSVTAATVTVNCWSKERETQT